MTTYDMLMQFYDKVGNPSDLSPYIYGGDTPYYSNVSANTIKIMGFLNRAYKYLANFKLPNGRIIRFRELTRTFFFTAVGRTLPTVTVQSVDKLTFTFAAASFKGNEFVGSYIKLTGTLGEINYRVIASNTTNTITITQAITGSVASPSVIAPVVYRRMFPVCRSTTEATAKGYSTGEYIVADTAILSFQRIRCMTNNQLLVPANRADQFYDFPSNYGIPSLYRFTNNGLEFDWAPINGTTFRIDAYCEPEELTVPSSSSDTTEPAIAREFHDVLWQLAAWMRVVQDKNMDEAAQDMNRIVSLLSTIVQPHEHDMDYVNAGVMILD